MKTSVFLTVTAILEIPFAIALFLAPSLVTHILLGAELRDPVASVIARVGGSAIFSIGLMCWLVRKEQNNVSLKALILGLQIYNIVVFATLAYSTFSFRSTPLLIVALVFHAVMAIFSFLSLQKFSRPV